MGSSAPEADALTTRPARSTYIVRIESTTNSGDGDRLTISSVATVLSALLLLLVFLVFHSLRGVHAAVSSQYNEQIVKSRIAP